MPRRVLVGGGLALGFLIAAAVPTAAAQLVSTEPLTSPTTLVPALPLPETTVPGLSTPGVTVPALSTPLGDTPTVTVPPLSTPPVSGPEVDLSSPVGAVRDAVTGAVSGTADAVAGLPTAVPGALPAPGVLVPAVPAPGASGRASDGLPDGGRPAHPTLGPAAGAAPAPAGQPGLPGSSGGPAPRAEAGAVRAGSFVAAVRDAGEAFRVPIALVLLLAACGGVLAARDRRDLRLSTAAREDRWLRFR